MFRCSRQILDTVISWSNLEIFEKDESVCCVYSTFIKMTSHNIFFLHLECEMQEFSPPRNSRCLLLLIVFTVDLKSKTE